jgi:hypothetical protein
MQPFCANPYEVPPICPLSTCLFNPSTRPPPLGRSCHQAQVCDIYGHCVWKEVCAGDK